MQEPDSSTEYPLPIGEDKNDENKHQRLGPVPGGLIFPVRTDLDRYLHFEFRIIREFSIEIERMVGSMGSDSID